MKRTILHGLAIVALIAPVAAQSPTGTTPVGTQDPNWTVSWTTTALGSAGAPANPGGYDAWVVNPVAGTWQPNLGGGPAWISAWQSASAPNGVGDYNGLTDAGHRYTYTFATSFLSAAGAFQFTMGWDNIFEAFVLNGTSYTPSDYLTSAVAGNISTHFGFCRNGDGVHLGAAYPNCVASFQVNGLVNGNNTLEIILRGDGTTDGLYFSGETPGGPTATVPEPATMTLLATGLAGIAGSSLRRRKKSTAV